MLSLQKINLFLRNENIGEANIENGIVQGDALSPLLFVIAIEPLCRTLNNNNRKVVLGPNFERNHLAFVDDIKLFAETGKELENLCVTAEECLDKMSLNINQQKSASNIISERTFGDLLNDVEGYKYLGILEDSTNTIKQSNKHIISRKIIDKTKALCKTELNAYAY